MKKETINDLCEIYTDFNRANGLNLGSADEHWYDETLTDEHRAWVRVFSVRWDQAAQEAK